MDVRHADPRLERIERDADFDGGFGEPIVKAFRRRMQLIRAAVDERAFYAMKSLHYEKLKGARADQRSMRLNDQFRLILRIEEVVGRRVLIISIEDYH
jgi:toxin HigB-1